jgi:hypothetical protein
VERAVADVALHEVREPRDGGTQATREIVEDGNALTRLDECEDDMTADIAGATRYDDAHVSFALSRKIKASDLFD